MRPSLRPFSSFGTSNAACIICVWNVYTEPLPSNRSGMSAFTEHCLEAVGGIHTQEPVMNLLQCFQNKKVGWKAILMLLTDIKIYYDIASENNNVLWRSWCHSPLKISSFRWCFNVAQLSLRLLIVIYQFHKWIFIGKCNIWQHSRNIVIFCYSDR